MAVDFRYGSAGIMKKLEAVAIHDRDVIAVVDQNVVAGEIVDNDMQIVELQQEQDQAFQNKLEIMPFPACQDIVAQRGTLAFRHDITDERYFGQRDLLRKGCKPIFGGEDFVYYVSASRIEDFSFDVIGGKYGSTEDSAVFKNSGVSERKARAVKKRSAGGQETDAGNKAVRKEYRDYSDLTLLQADICRMIESNPMLADNIAGKLGIDISEVLSELTVLELDGYVRSLPGKLFGTV